MTYGHIDLVVANNESHPYNACDDEGSFKDSKCAYPRFLEDILRNAYPDIQLNVHNLALRGCNSRCILNERMDEIKSLGAVDLALLHMTTNDRAEPMEYPLISAAFEALVRFLLTLPSRPAVLVIQMLMFVEASDRIYTPHLEVVRHYALPVIAVEQYSDSSSNVCNYNAKKPSKVNRMSNLDAWFGFLLELPLIVSELFKEQSEGLSRTWDTCPYDDKWWPVWRRDSTMHPEWPYHQALAQFLYAVWILHDDRAREAEGMPLAPIPQPLRPFTLDVATQTCYKRADLMSPGTWQGRYVERGGWVSGEDVAGKPGLWVDNAAGAVLRLSCP